MIVVDAGAFLEVLLRSPGGRVTQGLLGADDAAAPALFDAEVLHRVLLLEKRARLRRDQVDARVERLRAAPLLRLDHGPLLAAARRYGAALAGYDALYVAAAASLDATLVTTDARLARTATEQFGVAVTTVPTSGR